MEEYLKQTPAGLQRVANAEERRLAGGGEGGLISASLGRPAAAATASEQPPLKTRRVAREESVSQPPETEDSTSMPVDSHLPDVTKTAVVVDSSRAAAAPSAPVRGVVDDQDQPDSSGDMVVDSHPAEDTARGSDDMADAVDMLWVSDGLPQQHDGEHVVGEVYSPPRIVPVARAAGLPGGWSLDILTENAWGQNWDFDDPTVRAQAKKLLIETKPWILIGSPMCTWFSTPYELK